MDLSQLKVWEHAETDDWQLSLGGWVWGLVMQLALQAAQPKVLALLAEAQQWDMCASPADCRSPCR